MLTPLLVSHLILLAVAGTALAGSLRTKAPKNAKTAFIALEDGATVIS